MKEKKKSYLKVKWITEAPKEGGISCFGPGPLFTAEESESGLIDMSDEEYEKCIDNIFELFGDKIKTPRERFFHSMNMGCFE